MGLILGTYNEIDGTEIWLYNGTPAGWIKKGGFGAVNNREASAMAVFDGVLSWERTAVLPAPQNDTNE